MKDFFSEEQTRNYKDLYKNFTDFINILNLSLLAELNGMDTAAAQNPNAESSSSINRYVYAGFQTCGMSHLHL